MKKITKKLSAILTSVCIALFSFLGSSAYASETTDVSLDILEWTITIFAPWAIDFGDTVIQNVQQTVTIDTADVNTGYTVTWSTLSWSYFAIEDLKWANSGYTLKLASAPLILDTDTGVNIPSANILLDLTQTWWTWAWDQGWIFLLNWELPSEIDSPLLSDADFTSEATIISRTSATTPAAWRLWMYWVQPVFDIQVPKFQQLGSYTSTFTLTLTEL